MKGLVFTEFLEFVEGRFGEVVADGLLDAKSAEFESQGAYTAVGTYDAAELFALVGELARGQDSAPADLVRAFGMHLFPRFAAGYPQFFEDVDGVFAFLRTIDGHIHREVRKLYPDAELPVFEHEDPAPGRLVMTYRSSRALADLAEGLMVGCSEHFGERLHIAREDLSQGAGTTVRFTLERR